MAVALTPVKKKRGGQQGNQNARKHGFYSSTLTPEEISQIWTLISQEHTAPEMAILRIKLQSLIQYAPIDCRTLKEVTRLIVKWAAGKYHLNRSGRAYLKAAVANALEQYYGISEVREP